MSFPKSGRSTHILLLLLILLIAGVFRFWQLDSLPPGLYHDEAYNGLDALSLVQGKTFPQFYEGWELYAQDAHAERPPNETRWPVFFEGNFGREPFHIYLMALAIKLLGPTPTAIRIVPGIAGVLSVFTTFLAARALTESTPDTDASWPESRIPSLAIPLLAALMMAIIFPAVHFSRFGLRAMLLVPVETSAVFFFWHGVKKSQESNRKDTSFLIFLFFVASGFFVGLGLYTYAAARLFPLVFIFFVPLWFWRDRTALNRHWRHILAMGATAFLTAAPLLWFMIRYPYFLIFRISYVANRGLGTIEGKPWLTWLMNISRVASGLIWRGETHLRHNLPGRPYLDPIQATFFLLGGLIAIRQRLQLRLVFLWLWLLVMLLPSILSGDAPHFGRLIGAAPAVSIFIALGVSWLIGQLSRLPWKQGKYIFLATIGLLLGASILMTARDYFGSYARHPEIRNDFYEPDWQLGQLASAQPLDTKLFLVPPQEELATIYFALGDPDRLQSYNGNEGLIPAGVPERPVLYLLREEETGSLANLQDFFPNGITTRQKNGIIAFQVPADTDRLPSVQMTSDSFEDKILLKGWDVHQTADEFEVTLVWQVLSDLEKDYTAFVHLIDSDGHLVAQQDRQPAGYPTKDWQPGEIVVDKYIVELPVELSPGAYSLRTGFYYLPTLENLGEALTLGDPLNLPPSASQ